MIKNFLVGIITVFCCVFVVQLGTAADISKTSGKISPLNCLKNGKTGFIKPSSSPEESTIVQANPSINNSNPSNTHSTTVKPSASNLQAYTLVKLPVKNNIAFKGKTPQLHELNRLMNLGARYISKKFDKSPDIRAFEKVVTSSGSVSNKGPVKLNPKEKHDTLLLKVLAAKAQEMYVEIMPSTTSSAPENSPELTLDLLHKHANNDKKGIIYQWGNHESRIIKMSKRGDQFSQVLNGVEEGSVYRYHALTKDGKFIQTIDPMCDRTAFTLKTEWAKTFNHGNYKWGGAEKLWRAKDNIKRIVSEYMNHDGDHVTANIAQIYPSMFAEEGGFANMELMEKMVDDLKASGFNTIEIGPLPPVDGEIGWGYEGTLWKAITQLYGSPENFKAFVEMAHKKGMNVILDVQYNHPGPFDNRMGDLNYHEGNGWNPWGRKLNYEGPNSRPMREMHISAWQQWLVDYHLDGLRVDFSSEIPDSLLKESILFVRGNEKINDVVIHLEDHRDDPRTVSPLRHFEIGNRDQLNAAINAARQGRDVDNHYIAHVGADATWDAKTIHRIIAAFLAFKETHGYPGSLSEVEKVINETYLSPEKRVSGDRDHDEQGNENGQHPLSKALENIYDAMGKANGNWRKAKPGVFDFIAGHIANVKYKKGERADYINEALEIWKPEVQVARGYVRNTGEAFKPQDFENFFRIAWALERVSIAFNFFSKAGPKIANNLGQLGPWKFFTKWTDQDLLERVGEQKGYNIINAYKESLPNQPKYTYEEYETKIKKFYSDISLLFESTPAFKHGKTVLDRGYRHEPNVIQFIKQDKVGNQYLVVVNRGGVFPKFDLLNLPPNARWSEVISSDRVEYGGQDTFKDFKSFHSNSQGTATVKIPETSVIVFKRVKGP